MTSLGFQVLTFQNDCTASEAMMLRLLEQNPSINLGMKDQGLIPILIASQITEISVKVATILINYSNREDVHKDNKLIVNIQDSLGNTALHYSAILDNLEFIILIEKYGADLNITNNNNEKPIDVSPKNSKTYKYLKEKTSKTKSKEITRKDRKTIFFLKGKKFEVVKNKEIREVREQIISLAGHKDEFSDLAPKTEQLKEAVKKEGFHVYGLPPFKSNKKVILTSFDMKKGENSKYLGYYNNSADQRENRGKSIFFDSDNNETSVYEGYWRNGVFEGKGRFIGYQREDDRVFVLDGVWFESGKKFKGTVKVDDRVIDQVIMKFHVDLKVILKGEKKSVEHGLLISESGDTFSGKMTKGRIDGHGLQCKKTKKRSRFFMLEGVWSDKGKNFTGKIQINDTKVQEPIIFEVGMVEVKRLLDHMNRNYKPFVQLTKE